jgi:hypothetical protein
MRADAGRREPGIVSLNQSMPPTGHIGPSIYEFAGASKTAFPPDRQCDLLSCQLQQTGAFEERGALNRILTLTDNERRLASHRGVG